MPGVTIGQASTNPEPSMNTGVVANLQTPDTPEPFHQPPTGVSVSAVRRDVHEEELQEATCDIFTVFGSHGCREAATATALTIRVPGRFDQDTLDNKTLQANFGPNVERVEVRTSNNDPATIRTSVLRWLFGPEHRGTNTWPLLQTVTVRHLETFELDLDVFAGLQRLRSLTFADSEIHDATSGNSSARIASQLKTLTLAHCELTRINAALLDRMSSLETLDLSNNLIRRIDADTFSALSSLQKLELSDNLISHIADRAFQALGNLTEFHLDDNDLTTLTPSLFCGLSRLEQLDLDHVPVSIILRGTFDHMPNLRELEMSGMGLASVLPDLFSNNLQLQGLDLSNNILQFLSANLLSHLTGLTHLRLDHNQLETIPPGLFTDLTELDLLFLNDNKLTELASNVFADNTGLTRLNLQRNRLTFLPQTLLKPVTRSLTHLFLGQNRLSTIDQAIQGLSTLQALFAPSNKLESFTGRGLAMLTELDLSNNPLRWLPQFPASEMLATLRIQNHAITTLDLTPLLNLKALEALDVSTSPKVKAKATVDRNVLVSLAATTTAAAAAATAAAATATAATATAATATAATATGTAASEGSQEYHSLVALSARNVDMSHVFGVVRDEDHADARRSSHAPAFPLRVALEKLYLGWPHMDEASIPIHVLCDMMADEARELGLVGTAYETITLCHRTELDSVFLQDNVHLENLNIPTDHLAQLNVSNSKRLWTLSAPVIEVLDVSGTNLPPTSSFCDQWGTTMLFARNMHNDGFNSAASVRQLLRECLLKADTVDLSHNKWLNHPTDIASVTGQTTVLSTSIFKTADLTVELPSRTLPPAVHLRNGPVTCQLVLQNQLLRLASNFETVSTELTFHFECGCAVGFNIAPDGSCVPALPSIFLTAEFAMIVGVVFTLFLIPMSVWFYRRHRRYRGLSKRVDLQDQLLMERDEEVMALKKAWEIEYDELRMIKRVAAGAFGVVFKAEWDTVTVAVKVLQQGVMMFDDSMVVEFEKEVEFLQRTRHPNVVRFFGAGTDPNGSPFLVLEFVAMGSLKDLLSKDIGKVLLEVRAAAAAQAAKEQHGDRPLITTTDVLADDVTLVNTGGPDTTGRRSLHMMMTTWELKLQLLRDVASGMAFIHSLDQMHRDLKSGNVLVSVNLRAKITDFGSIRQCLTSQPRVEATSSSSFSTDSQYTQQRGLATTTDMSLTAGVGTPLYMAPEALTGDKYSFEADIFSFGVLMWEVATQRPPDLIEQEKGSDFRGPLLATLVRLLGEGKRLRFTAEDEATVPEWYKNLIKLCVAEDPQERPSFSQLCTHHLSMS
ncbi:TKL protein kinase [Salpingoeca rosetta]|uniref:TKL protein kinase n=1 Tax=Salpingoeca rosetta (strain ATCC 50818 / BSB-021) TaxID=946362 RepID=F2UNV7_SALR5|nr:TKL protein kinase [Salpingoeca rosetta]EGD79312.1 TKL protein kinase [Salpingoeca rosetta]|eukprot:XP_004989081.1 TKL protein kinase [Salpingoeca rosetta]